MTCTVYVRVIITSKLHSWLIVKNNFSVIPFLNDSVLWTNRLNESYWIIKCMSHGSYWRNDINSRTSLWERANTDNQSDTNSDNSRRVFLTLFRGYNHILLSLHSIWTAKLLCRASAARVRPQWQQRRKHCHRAKRSIFGFEDNRYKQNGVVLKTFYCKNRHFNRPYCFIMHASRQASSGNVLTGESLDAVPFNRSVFVRLSLFTHVNDSLFQALLGSSCW